MFFKKALTGLLYGATFAIGLAAVNWTVIHFDLDGKEEREQRLLQAKKKAQPTLEDVIKLRKWEEERKEKNRLDAQKIIIKDMGSQVGDWMEVMVTLTNGSDRKFIYVMADVNLFDASGRFLDQCSAGMVEHFLPGETRHVKAICDRISEDRLKRVNSYEIFIESVN